MNRDVTNPDVLNSYGNLYNLNKINCNHSNTVPFNNQLSICLKCDQLGREFFNESEGNFKFIPLVIMN